MVSDPLVIADRTFRSRLIVGTGKYPSHAVMADAHGASGTDMVTVAVRRVNLTDRSQESLLDYIDRERIFILPNTAGCYTADEAIRTARLGREVGLSNWASSAPMLSGPAISRGSQFTRIVKVYLKGEGMPKSSSSRRSAWLPSSVACAGSAPRGSSRVIARVMTRR